MADKTKIEWTDATWNPVTGCSIVSPGCTNCYAMKLAGTRLKHHPSRIGLTRETKAGPVWNGELRLNTEWLDQPLKWKQPRMIFVCAHGDLFAEGVPDGWIMQVLLTMGQAHQHVFQILTKRPDRMRDFFRRWADTTGEDHSEFKQARGPDEVRKTHPSPRGQLFADMLESMGKPPAGAAYPFFDWMGGMMFWPDVFRNIWLGVSVEDQKRADERIPLLLDTPAAVRWISAEPLLGPIDLRNVAGTNCLDPKVPTRISAAVPAVKKRASDQAVLGWVVAGGESGPDARPMHPDWVRALRDQCREADVSFLFKQWGNWLGGEAEDMGDSVYFTAASSKKSDRFLHPHDRFDWFDENHAPDGPLHLWMKKQEAGRLLDGVEHNGFPRLPAQFRTGAQA